MHVLFSRNCVERVGKIFSLRGYKSERVLFSNLSLAFPWTRQDSSQRDSPIPELAGVGKTAPYADITS